MPWFCVIVFKVTLKCGNLWNSVGLSSRKYKQRKAWLSWWQVLISCTEHFCESADFVRLFDQLEGFAEWVEKKNHSLSLSHMWLGDIEGLSQFGHMSKVLSTGCWDSFWSNCSKVSSSGSPKIFVMSSSLSLSPSHVPSQELPLEVSLVIK